MTLAPFRSRVRDARAATPPSPAPVVPKPDATPERVVKRVPIDSIVLRRNPRLAPIDMMRIAKLRDTIKSHGQIQAIVVRPLKAGDPRRTDVVLYELVAGERRYHATREAQLPDIEAAIEEMDDARADDIAALENAAREPLTLWSIIHECARRKSAGQDSDDVARLMHLAVRDVDDFALMHDDLAPELFAKLERAPEPTTVRSLVQCARSTRGLATKARHEAQRKWWKADVARRLAKADGKVSKPRKSSGPSRGLRPSARTTMEIADAIERDRQIINPRTKTLIDLDADTAHAVAEGYRHIARPAKHARPV